MPDKIKLVSSLLTSIAGILLFISLAHYIDLNGMSQYSPYIATMGLIMLFWPDLFLKITKPVHFIHKPLILTISHILIFIGLKVYLDQFIHDWALLYIVLGIIFLNSSETIAKKLVDIR